MVYAHRDDTLSVNLFVAGEAEIPIAGNRVQIRQETRYPWDGKIGISVDPEEEGEFAVLVRIPGWATGRPVPSELYRYLPMRERKKTRAVVLSVNRSRIVPEIEGGFARIRRAWKKGDRIDLDLPMPVRRVVADDRVVADRGRVALERGPIVYCLEGADHLGDAVSGIALPDESALEAEHVPDLLGGVTVIRGEGLLSVSTESGMPRIAKTKLLAVPYFAWGHRGVGEMTVWIPRSPSAAEPRPLPTTASLARPSASHVWAGDTERALNDLRDPERSSDHSLPRHTWWDHRGTTEWVQYDLAAPSRVTKVEVYWFDDTGEGSCRVPASWRLLWRDDETWKEVENASGYGVAKDRFNEVTFDPVQTGALRLEVELQPGFSGGILEWRVLP
jgi:hypothetical protein